MDDNTLNIHLSSLCNSLTDAATDAIKVSKNHDHIWYLAFSIYLFRFRDADRQMLRHRSSTAAYSTDFSTKSKHFVCVGVINTGSRSSNLFFRSFFRLGAPLASFPPVSCVLRFCFLLWNVHQLIVGRDASAGSAAGGAAEAGRGMEEEGGGEQEPERPDAPVYAAIRTVKEVCILAPVCVSLTETDLFRFSCPRRVNINISRLSNLLFLRENGLISLACDRPRCQSPSHLSWGAVPISQIAYPN